MLFTEMTNTNTIELRKNRNKKHVLSKCEYCMEVKEDEEEKKKYCPK